MHMFHLLIDSGKATEIVHMGRSHTTALQLGPYREAAI